MQGEKASQRESKEINKQNWNLALLTLVEATLPVLWESKKIPQPLHDQQTVLEIGMKVYSARITQVRHSPLAFGLHAYTNYAFHIQLFLSFFLSLSWKEKAKFHSK